uniref:Uncharacterized protein n=1 Tax=Schizaphis graminum TaxID=13262 RepID=A0A2S2NHI7_SCHGA
MIESRVGFLEKIVCNQMSNLKLDESTQSTENKSTDNSLEMRENCVEWWCPLHSKFKEILGNISVQNQTLEDKYLIRKTKARFEYWQGGNKNISRCPTYDMKKGQAIHYSPPSCWPKNSE